MDPLLKQVAHAEGADLGVSTAAPEIGAGQAGDQRGAVAPQRGQLVEQRGQRPRAVAAGARDLVLIPRLQRRIALGEQDPDAAGESPSLGLDQVTDDLLDAPLARRWMPGRQPLRQRAQLGGERGHRRAQQRGDLGRRQRDLGHQTLVTIEGGASPSARSSAAASAASCS